MTLERLRLVAITNRHLCRGPLEDSVAQVIEGGATTVMLREKDLSPRDLYHLALRIRPVCESRDALFIVNHSLEVALAAGANGAHLGVASIPPPVARGMAPSPFLLGFSAHDLDELNAVESAGFDYCTMSPVFYPTSKEFTSPPLGIEGLARMTAATELPVVALGGITTENAGVCIENGAAGVSAIGTLFGSESPYHAARQMARAVAL